MSVTKHLDLFWEVQAIHPESRWWKVCQHLGRIKFHFCWKNTDQAEVGALERLPPGRKSVTLTLVAPILYREHPRPTTDLSLLHEAEFNFGDGQTVTYSRDLLAEQAQALGIELEIAPQELSGETCVIEHLGEHTFSAGINPPYENFGDRLRAWERFSFDSLWAYPAAFDMAGHRAGDRRMMETAD